MMQLLMCWLGVMSLVEAKKIWDLRKRRLLHTHALFQVARSWQRSERDSYGNSVHRLNHSDFDDEAPLMRGSCRDAWVSLCEASQCGRGWTCAGCLTCMLPCLFRPRGAVVGTADPEALAADPGRARASGLIPGAAAASGAGQNFVQAASSEQAAQVRAQRDRLLARVETRRASQQKTVRELEEERGAADAAQVSGSEPALPQQAFNVTDGV